MSQKRILDIMIIMCGVILVVLVQFYIGRGMLQWVFSVGSILLISVVFRSCQPGLWLVGLHFWFPSGKRL